MGKEVIEVLKLYNDGDMRKVKKGMVIALEENGTDGTINAVVDAVQVDRKDVAGIVAGVITMAELYGVTTEEVEKILFDIKGVLADGAKEDDTEADPGTGSDQEGATGEGADPSGQEAAEPEEIY